MVNGSISPEILFLQSRAGGAIVILISLVAFTAMILWARRPGRRERVAAVWAAAGTTLLVAILSMIAVAMGWWSGQFFSIPIIVLAAIYIPLSIFGYTLWLGVYRALRRFSRRALLIYAIVVLAFIPVIFLVDPIQMQRGQFTMGRGYTVWADALMGQVVMWSPVVFYEAIRKQIGSSRGLRTETGKIK